MGAIRTMLTNIAQILLLFVLIPIFAAICEPFNSTSAISGLISFLGQVDLISSVADILSGLSGSITSNDIANATVWTFVKEFPAAIIAGISVHFCITGFNVMWDAVRLKMPGFKPLPILPGFLGIALSVIITNIIGLTNNDALSFFIEIGIIVVAFFALKMIFSGRWGRSLFSIKRVLLWLIEGIYAVIIATYIAGMLLIMRGYEHSSPIMFVITLSTITFIASVLTFFARRGVAADEG